MRDATIRRILGENDGEDIDNLPVSEPEETAPELPTRLSQDAQTDELANLWKSGNKTEVINRFLEMDNKTSVKLVFAIGLEGAMELAHKVDDILKSRESHDEEPDETEPTEEIDPTISKITGQVPQGTAAEPVT